ncbi:DUF2935 domain-containing protein [Alteribacillus iranensis]|uniref:DUF2935 domain-containing protein n=1 Tax=Alteribacillus iranensis TaxID=930128 RepID=A0A1I2DLD5_9BACI|nr:DUF2935 domain-containing protein [Alteribacillus iranensis]SFE81083.1 protein of unknown function [Alteribacillus iranensis]
MYTNWVEAAREEHVFWLQILGDHSRFLYETLAPSEVEYIEAASGYIDFFDQLLEWARKYSAVEDMERITQQAFEGARDIRFFKLQIIQEQLTGKIKIQLTPSFINHMVNEVEEYLRLLECLKNKEVPPVCHPLHHHLIWLLDAAGHAHAIAGNLDKVEARLAKKSKTFMKEFDQFYLKAVEMAGYLRANVESFPALERMNREVKLEFEIFKSFLRELEEMGLTKELLSSLTPLMADHMAREECYYLMKLAESADLEKPACNPSKPRTES